MQSHGSLRNAAIRFNVAKSDVRQWYLLFKEKVPDAFGSEKRVNKVSGGRHRGMISQEVRGSEVASSSREELEKLRKRNAYLEMENEFLKTRCLSPGKNRARNKEVVCIIDELRPEYDLGELLPIAHMRKSTY